MQNRGYGGPALVCIPGMFSLQGVHVAVCACKIRKGKFETFFFKEAPTPNHVSFIDKVALPQLSPCEKWKTCSSERVISMPEITWAWKWQWKQSPRCPCKDHVLKWSLAIPFPGSGPSLPRWISSQLCFLSYPQARLLLPQDAPLCKLERAPLPQGKLAKATLYLHSVKNSAWRTLGTQPNPQLRDSTQHPHTGRGPRQGRSPARGMLGVRPGLGTAEHQGDPLTWGPLGRWHQLPSRWPWRVSNLLPRGTAPLFYLLDPDKPPSTTCHLTLLCSPRPDTACSYPHGRGRGGLGHKLVPQETGRRVKETN